MANKTMRQEFRLDEDTKQKLDILVEKEPSQKVAKLLRRLIHEEFSRTVEKD